MTRGARNVNHPFPHAGECITPEQRIEGATARHLNFGNVEKGLEEARDRRAYDLAYLDMETCGMDLTYCILANLTFFAEGVRRFTDFVSRESRRATDLRERFGQQLNPRQRALLEHTLRHPRYHYLVVEHRHWHGIADNTARNDFADLVAKGYLDSHKEGRLLYFTDTGLFRRLVQ